MNVDEAMEVITGAEPSCLEHLAGAVLVAEVERLRAELAAAKAASVCPVRVQNIYDAEYPSDCYIECWNGDECMKFRDWLYDRIKERDEG